MKKFYEVDLDGNDCLYFQDYFKAKDFLYEFYLEYYSHEYSEEEQIAIKEQLTLDDNIPGVGCIWTRNFED